MEQKHIDPTQVQLFRQPVGEVEISLPCGLLLEDGIAHNAKITPMTGKDRKDMADPANQRNGAKVITNLLANRLTQLGPYSFPVPIKAVRQLLAGDRDFIIYELHKISNPGKEALEGVIVCPSRECQAQVEFEIPYSDIEVTPMPQEYQEQVHPDKQCRYWTFKDDDWGIDAAFRFVDGSLQEAVAPKLRKNVVEGEYALFAKMLLGWNGLKALSVQQIETLPNPVVVMIENALAERKFGPKFDPHIVCSECGMAIRGGVDFSSFLFR